MTRFRLVLSSILVFALVAAVASVQIAEMQRNRAERFRRAHLNLPIRCMFPPTRIPPVHPSLDSPAAGRWLPGYSRLAY